MVIVLSITAAAACDGPVRNEDETVTEGPTEAEGDEEQAEDHDRMAEATDEIGEVDFETSCEEEAQAPFEFGLGALHHMMYDEARAAFEEAIEADPDCAMGHWGVAMTYYTPLWYPPEAEDLEEGSAAIEQAQQLEANEREEAFIDAVDAFFEGEDVELEERAEAFRQGWEDAHERDEEDVEAAAFYALSLLATAPAVTDDYTQRERAGELMEEVLEREPRHPGGHHYLLHAYDAPPLADRAVEVARGYSDIAPTMPHALHMPSHIFVRLGEWDDTIEWDTRAAEAARDHRVDGDTSMHYYHSLDYLAHAYLQQGRDEKAEQVAPDFEEAEDPEPILGAAYPAVAIPARIAVEQRNWEAAADLEPLHADAFPFERWPVTGVVRHAVRAVGAVQSDDMETAREEFERVEQLEEEVAEADDPHWAPHAQAYRDLVEAMIAYGEGNTEEAIDEMEEVADFQDSFDKHPTMPGRILEARDYLGMMQLEEEEYADALDTFEEALEQTPNRFHLIYGAAQAAHLGDEPEVAERYYGELVDLADHDGVDREEVEEARQYLEQLQTRR